MARRELAEQPAGDKEDCSHPEARSAAPLRGRTKRLRYPMPHRCHNRTCRRTPAWMPVVLLAAAVYHLAFAVWTNVWPHQWFDECGLARLSCPLPWRVFGLLSGAFGVGFLVAAARGPLRHWPIVLAGFIKFAVVVIASIAAVSLGELPWRALWLFAIDDLIWLPPFAAMLWKAMLVHFGQPPSRETPLTIEEAAATYQLSSGETLAEAAREQTLVLVFLRHFGCTFTRQLLRGLQDLEADARKHGARLVLVHMLQRGRESEYLGKQGDVARISDPACELYRAFGLGKGGFLELLGPVVWIRGIAAVFSGCGVGHLAGDGLQMPGAFLFRDGQVLAAQPARNASQLPNLPALFQTGG